MITVYLDEKFEVTTEDKAVIVRYVYEDHTVTAIVVKDEDRHKVILKPATPAPPAVNNLA